MLIPSAPTPRPVGPEWNPLAGSCRGRCYELEEVDPPGCRCDSHCQHYFSCCSDFEEQCVKTGETLLAPPQLLLLTSSVGPMCFITLQQLFRSGITLIKAPGLTILMPLEGGFECTPDRCGEERDEKHACHCSQDCLERGDCCSNYQSTCKGC